MKIAARFLLSGALLALCACTVGPNYTRPQTPAPPAFRGPDNTEAPGSAGSLGDRSWEEIFPGQELQALIRAALENNFDLRIAAQHILEQQAQVRFVRSQQFPSLSGGGTGAGADLPSSVGSSIGSPLAFGSFSLSGSWAPDFWGLYRRQTEAARAQLLAQTWARRAVRLSIVSQVAAAYIGLRALDHQLAIARQTLKTRQESVDLTTRLEHGGAALVGFAAGGGLAVRRHFASSSASSRISSNRKTGCGSSSARSPARWRIPMRRHS